MKKALITLAAFAAACSAPAQKQKPKQNPVTAASTVQVPQDTFFIPDPRDVEYDRTHPEAVAEGDRNQQELREVESKASGLKWIALKDAGLHTREMIIASNPDGVDDLRRRGLYMNVATYDFDKDNKPDLVYYDWSDGRSEGYTYIVVFGNTQKPNRYFFGRSVRPYKQGILVDRAYSVL